MKIKYLQPKSETYGVLAFNRVSNTIAHVHHFNEDDGHYSYSYEVSGTPQELNIVEEFCARLSGYHGKKNPYTSIDCEHSFIEISAKEANKNSLLKYGKNVDAHPGIPDFKIYQCSKCEQNGKTEFKGYEVDTFSCDFSEHLIVIFVQALSEKQVPKEITDEHKRAYYVDPAVETKLLKMGFKRDSYSCGYLGNIIYFKFTY